MSHLNYFEPYQSKEKNHEDQLTRAFLVVLRHSTSVLLMFYDYSVRVISNKIRDKQAKGNHIDIDLPSISNLDFDRVDIKTQEINSKLEADQVVSVLITDDSFEPKEDVKKENRQARYDGIVQFSSVALIIENKPRNYNVWEAQLNPGIKNLAEDVQLIPIAAILEWKEIIRILNSLMSLESFGGAEKIIVSDFLSFVDDQFPFLNPYDNFELCKDNNELLQRRIKNVLESISLKKENVKYHRGWAYYIETDFDEIFQIGLKLVQNDVDWNIELSLFIADTVGQARSYYAGEKILELLDSLKEQKWKIEPNFHIGFMQKGILWFNTDISLKDYLNYWFQKQGEIRRYHKNELFSYLEKLNELKIINYDEQKKRELTGQIMNRNFFNVCPGFGLIYTFDSKEAIKLDNESKFSEVLKSKIREGLSILNKPITFLQK